MKLTERQKRSREKSKRLQKLVRGGMSIPEAAKKLGISAFAARYMLRRDGASSCIQDRSAQSRKTSKQLQKLVRGGMSILIAALELGISYSAAYYMLQRDASELIADRSAQSREKSKQLQKLVRGGMSNPAAALELGICPSTAHKMLRRDAPDRIMSRSARSAQSREKSKQLQKKLICGGMSIPAAALELGIPYHTAYYMLRRDAPELFKDLSARRYKILDQILALTESGATILQIADRLNLTPDQIKNRLRRAGLA